MYVSIFRTPRFYASCTVMHRKINIEEETYRGNLPAGLRSPLFSLCAEGPVQFRHTAY